MKILGLGIISNSTGDLLYLYGQESAQQLIRQSVDGASRTVVQRKIYDRGDDRMLIARGMHHIIVMVFSDAQMAEMNEIPITDIEFMFENEYPEEFESLLVHKFQLIENGGITTKQREVLRKMNEVKSQMLGNVNGLLERSDKLEELKDESDDLKETSTMFRVVAKEPAKKMRKRNVCLVFVIIAVLLCAAVSFLLIICSAAVVLYYIMECVLGECTEVVRANNIN